MKTPNIKNAVMLIALMLAVVISVPFAGALILLLRTAGLLVIFAGLGGMAIAVAFSPTIRGRVCSFGATATEPDVRTRIGGI